jgi:cell fate regulator YaaT (PSP1 superfamily)
MNEGPRSQDSGSSRPDGATRADTRSLVKVRLSRNGRVLDCDSGGLVLRQGDKVLVDDRRSTALGVVTAPSSSCPRNGVQGRVIRRAEPRDFARAEQEEQRQAEALAFARDRARTLGLPIKLFRVELGQGGDRALFFFSCEQRVDFRGLVRDLAAELRARIEMRQVGVRDESRMTGGIGSCGRELCCATYLSRFAPISIKMAKHQRLVLNPNKIAGQCSRLKCCLVYEDDLYVELSKNLPKPGKKVETPEGVGRVEDLDVLGGRVRVSFFERPPMTFAAADVRPIAPDPGAAVTPEPVVNSTSDSDENPTGDNGDNGDNGDTGGNGSNGSNGG